MTTDQVVLELPSGARGLLRVVTSSTTLYPTIMRRLRRGADDEPQLWVAPAASPAAIEYARNRGDSLVTDAGLILLHVQTEAYEIGRDEQRPPPLPRGRRPWGTFAVVRRLLEIDVDRQADLALLTGLSQERVSRILSGLRMQGLTTRVVGSHGRTVERVAQPLDLFDWWLDGYPAGAALTAHYFSGQPLRSQLEHAAGALSGRRPLLSGDLAADELAPWRRPGHVLLYCAEPVDLTGVGFVAAPQADATLTVVTTPDPSVALPVRAGGLPWAQISVGDLRVELADPLQVLLDLAVRPASETQEGVDRLREQFLGGRLRERVRDWLEVVISESREEPQRRPTAAPATTRRKTPANPP